MSLSVRIVKYLRPEDGEHARQIQSYLAAKVRIVPFTGPPRLIAAVDASFSDDTVVAVASLYSYPDLSNMEDACVEEKVRYPYIPGYLSFREGPAVIQAIGKLQRSPDVVLFDGQGIAHPRGLGLASHVGVILGLPAIGCAKSRLLGSFKEPKGEKGDWTYLYSADRVRRPIGAVVRSQRAVKPLFVSPGHLIDIECSVDIVLHCVTAYRVPEPLRHADMLSRRKRREGIKISEDGIAASGAAV